MKKFLFIVSLVATAASVSFAKSAKQTYNSIGSAEMSVQIMANGDYVLGQSLQEKWDDNQICQKNSAVVPNPKYTYSCFEKIQSVDAKKMYDSLKAREYTLGFIQDGVGDPVLGASEKSIGDLFCRMWQQVEDAYTPSYDCFLKKN